MSRPGKRSLWDATITEVLAGYYEPDEHGPACEEHAPGCCDHPRCPGDK